MQAAGSAKKGALELSRTHIKQEIPRHLHLHSSTSKTFSRRLIKKVDQHEVLNYTLRGGFDQVSPASSPNISFNSLTILLVSRRRLLKRTKS
jgi:hypothetical protein